MKATTPKGKDIKFNIYIYIYLGKKLLIHCRLFHFHARKSCWVGLSFSLLINPPCLSSFPDLVPCIFFPH